MTAMFLSKREREVIQNSLHSRAVDIMRLINDSYVTVDPDRAVEVREKLYDEMDEVDALLDRFNWYD